MRRKIRMFGLLLLLLLVGIPLAGFWVSGYLHRPLPLEEPVLVEVAPGSSFNGLLAGMRADGLLGEPPEARLRRWSARLYSAFTGVDARLHVGEYQLNPGDSLLTLLEKIDRGDVLQRSVTLVEGWNFREWRARLAGLEGIEHTLVDLDGAAVMARLGRPGAHPEGWFAPETYFYTRGTRDVDLLRRALERQQRILDQAWAARDEDLPYDTPYEALIMASIVEKETAVPAERGRIAGVFINRLRKGMRLQTDPTVIYGMGTDYDGNIRRSDLRRKTPYNTYAISGLPPTPIAMPSRESILAAVSPEPTEDLFFVARGDGSHKFSRTLAEHQRAVREYQLKRRENYRSSPEPRP
ncbi:MAG TPA: endolytic transglycosylase MltG [Alcanivorax sp.]|uniref:endolytic transglycosylase MltG n=2 Tax=Alloalcanivorax venustensis TaxID=172371 RepID=UPI000E8792AC|nr:endolytic transglycosylase MltG [Alcanivorax sp.]MEC8880708.1 endolytic transglycosylase MltG [Pseudomonadota bacterium]MEE3009323.1 endolytic transglycosylase MltG [Pseudomonadota bacterium]HBP74304.1 endolytic transglycosylase MltG [Alcanivorax sp.]HBY47827.1 endolytic transglycosylase MltG [Alcanivorax sp.]|tara:strand:- start:4821 stop:5879 length:1059 start_codon:yes stop_codon:yes gene_type:complete